MVDLVHKMDHDPLAAKGLKLQLSSSPIWFYRLIKFGCVWALILPFSSLATTITTNTIIIPTASGAPPPRPTAALPFLARSTVAPKRTNPLLLLRFWISRIGGRLCLQKRERLCTKRN